MIDIDLEHPTRITRKDRKVQWEWELGDTVPDSLDGVGKVIVYLQVDHWVDRKCFTVRFGRLQRFDPGRGFISERHDLFAGSKLITRLPCPRYSAKQLALAEAAGWRIFTEQLDHPELVEVFTTAKGQVVEERVIAALGGSTT